MDKKKLIPILIVSGILLVGLIIFLATRGGNKGSEDEAIRITVPESVKEKTPDISQGAPSTPQENTSHSDLLRLKINGRSYLMDLRSGFAASEFRKRIPMTFYMQNQNGDRLVSDIDGDFTLDNKTPSEIQPGDVVLMNGNLVIFYKAIDTPDFECTIIGNIEQFSKIEGDVTIEFNY